jgi:hypothetical protein
MIIPTKDTKFSDFVGSIVTDFPKDNIPISKNEDDWKLWGSFLIQENSFAKNGAPSPVGFKNRTQWEQAIFQTMV